MAAATSTVSREDFLRGEAVDLLRASWSASESDAEDNYLNRHITLMPQGLNPLVQKATEACAENPSSYRTTSMLWKTAGIVIIVASIALSVGALAAVAYFYPVYVPFVPLAAIALNALVMTPVEACFNYSYDNEKIHEKKEHIQRIQQERLGQVSPSRLEEIVRNDLLYGFSNEEISEDLSDMLTSYDFKPIIAESLYCQEKINDLARKIGNLQTRIDQGQGELLAARPESLQDPNMVELQEKLRNYFTELDLLGRERAMVKAQLACRMSILAQPSQNTNFPDRLYHNFFSRTSTGNPVDTLEREALRHVQEPHNFVLRLFNRSIYAMNFPNPADNLTFMQLIRMSTPDLARHITQAINQSLDA